MKRSTLVTLLVGFFLVSYFTFPSFNLFNGGMFGFQDPTQVGRVTSFINNLKTGHIPPRLAPEYSFHLGFPVFNFYAPTAYWITSSIGLLGFSAITAVKLSFLLSMYFSFFGMFYFLSQLFSHSRKDVATLIGASVYVTSTYFATEVVVRGNLAECWFLALFPTTLGLLIHNSKTHKKSVQILTTCAFALLFTTHNMMLLFAILISFIFLLFFPQKRKNLLAACSAILIDSYFFIPAFMEGSLVQANVVAKEYIYTDHFLCAWQLWTSKLWVFGGSLPGCDSPLEMSFKIGKIQIMLGAFGLAFFGWNLMRKKKVVSDQRPLLFTAFISIGALFLTLYPSQFIWHFFEPVMALFQFPWRFIVFGLFGIAVFAGFLFQAVRFPLQKLLIFVLLLILFIPARKYFITPTIPFEKYQQQYNSDEYFSNHLAYKMPEYLVKGANLAYWRSLEPTPEKIPRLGFDPNQAVQSESGYQSLLNGSFYKSLTVLEPGPVIINIHYFPFWTILINNQKFVPTELDPLARPILHLTKGDNVTIAYEQTVIEKVADLFSLVGIIFLLATALYPAKVGTHELL